MAQNNRDEWKKVSKELLEQMKDVEKETALLKRKQLERELLRKKDAVADLKKAIDKQGDKIAQNAATIAETQALIDQMLTLLASGSTARTIDEVRVAARKNPMFVLAEDKINRLKETQTGNTTKLANLASELEKAEHAVIVAEDCLDQYDFELLDEKRRQLESSRTAAEAAAKEDHRGFTYSTDLRAGLLVAPINEHPAHVVQNQDTGAFSVQYGEPSRFGINNNFNLSFNAMLDTNTARELGPLPKVLSLGFWNPDRDRIGFSVMGGLGDEGPRFGLGPTLFYGRDGDVGLTFGLLFYSANRVAPGFFPTKIDEQIPFDKVIRSRLFLGLTYKLASVGENAPQKPKSP